MNILAKLAQHIANVEAVSGWMEYPSPVDGNITVGQLLEKFKEKFRDKIFVFFDFETSGLPPDLHIKQVSQVHAVAIDVKHFIQSGMRFDPDIIGEFGSKAHLTEYSEEHLDDPAKDGGFNIRKVFDYNEHGLRRDFESRGKAFPEPPAGYMAPKKPSPKTFSPYRNEEFDLNVDESEREFEPEESLLRRFVAFLFGMSTKGEIVLVAHNAAFDAEFLFRRCDFNGINTDFLKLREPYLFDDQAFERLYVVPMINLMQDPTLRERFKEAYRGKPNVMGMDYINAALGQLDISKSHKAVEDTKNMILALAKFLRLMEENKDLDVKPALGQAAKSHRDLKSRDSIKRDTRMMPMHEYREKYMRSGRVDTPEVKSARREIESIRNSLKNQGISDLDFLKRSDQVVSLHPAEFAKLSEFESLVYSGSEAEAS